MSFKESLISGIALTIKGIAKGIEVVQTATPHIKNLQKKPKIFQIRVLLEHIELQKKF